MWKSTLLTVRRASFGDFIISVRMLLLEPVILSLFLLWNARNACMPMMKYEATPLPNCHYMQTGWWFTRAQADFQPGSVRHRWLLFYSVYMDPG